MHFDKKSWNDTCSQRFVCVDAVTVIKGMVMRKSFLALVSAMLVGAIAQFSAVASNAQDAANSVRNRNNANSDRNDRNDRNDQNASSDQANVGKLDRRTSGSNVRASQLIGANIQNDSGESVGEVNDLVIDGSSGRVRYAAVTYGGFLGVGSKLFAVPFDAFHVKKKSNNSNDYVLVLNVTKQQLEGARGFDKDNWPDFADRSMTRELDQRYNVDRTANRPRGSDRGVNNRNRSGANGDRGVGNGAGAGTGTRNE
jgi:sporulation protein YlmC with PRC-barrel domain